MAQGMRRQLLRDRLGLFVAIIKSTLLFLLSILRLVARRSSSLHNDEIRRDLELAARALPKDTYSSAMIRDLPEPARRYLTHTFKDGVKLPRGIRLRVTGRFNLGNPAGWWPMRAEQWIVPCSGFLWTAKLQAGLLAISGSDWCLDNRAGQCIDLWDAIPVMRSSNNLNVDRSALGRLLIESVMVPAVLLPSRGARWQPLPDGRIAVHAGGLDERHPPLKLTLAEQGRLVRAELQRWGDPVARRRYGWYTFYVEVLEENERDGIILPRRIEAGWVHSGATDHPFYRATMTVVELL